MFCFLCNYAYTETQVATLRPCFRGLDLGLGFDLVTYGLGLGLDTTILIPITDL